MQPDIRARSSCAWRRPDPTPDVDVGVAGDQVEADIGDGAADEDPRPRIDGHDTGTAEPAAVPVSSRPTVSTSSTRISASSSVVRGLMKQARSA